MVQKISAIKQSGIFTATVIACASVFTTGLIQYLLLAADLRNKISSRMFFLNIFCVLVLYLAAQAVFNHLGAACITAHMLIFLFAMANYFVYEFRGNEIIFADLRTVLTGLSVASNYRFSLNARVVIAILLTMLFVAGCLRLKVRCKRVAQMRILCLSAALFFTLFVAQSVKERTTETWEQKGTYQNGFLLNFALSVRDSFVEKPKSYSDALIANIEERYMETEDVSAKEKPAIIVIMNESFADLRVFGELETNAPVLPFWDSLNENTIKGYAIASVYGAKTPNSEWEFLTGNSMAFLPSGSVPYQQYLKEENAYSILDTLKLEDYTCVAMHPYYETGWSRNLVYPKLGFDETYFLEKFDQSNLMRQYVSDATMYEKIIERFEGREAGENLFLFGVTMQNHGGYKDVYENFATDVYGTKEYFADVDQYLSLAHQSDLAIGNLLEYFAGIKEPVVVCFFGDHQPSLEPDFYVGLNGKGQANLTLSELEEFFSVPFFIWTNYESGSREIDQVSLNFLSVLLFRQAGISLSPYQRFLADLMRVVPAMNARAYYSGEYKQYVHYGEGRKEDEIWIERYRNLQYNGLFDEKNRSSIFFCRYDVSKE